MEKRPPKILQGNYTQSYSIKDLKTYGDLDRRDIQVGFYRCNFWTILDR